MSEKPAVILVGTSGYNYPEWKGSFYPEDLPLSQMLPYYAARFSTVEINYTFYRLPNEKTLAGWAHGTPANFTLTLKAPRRITHDARLRDCEDLVQTFVSRAQALGPKLGVLLFQLPPWARVHLAVLDTFLGWLPAGTRAAMEFRHASWLTDDVYGRLRARGVALCVTDNGETTTPVVDTGDYGYFRLRDEGYGEADIERWAGVIKAQGERWKDTYVYFKHEEAGKGPEFARLLMQRLGLAQATA